jgi:tetratricopeptide (TPR) repeat protein
LDPGENAIEVVAYNRRNLLASLPAQTTITYTAPTDKSKPKLYVLAIGINKYVDRGGIAPGETETKLFPPLKLAVDDAKALSAALQGAGQGLYAEVRVRTVLDREATAPKLDAIVTQMSAEIQPRDTFVLFAAAHGYSNEGRFYLIPQDYQGGPNPKALAGHAIDQLRLQDWIANRIKAKNALILLDTCESGALTSGFARSRFDGPASEAGVGRLHEATGRPVLTAAAQGQFAHEGQITSTGEHRGIFTWAVLDALRNGDEDNDGLIELSELVNHVQKVVPGIAQGLARAVTQSEPVLGVQTPRFGFTGGDFPFVQRIGVVNKKSFNETWATIYVNRGTKLLSQGKETDAKAQFELALQRGGNAANQIVIALVKEGNNRLNTANNGSSDAKAMQISALALFHQAIDWAQHEGVGNSARADAYFGRGRAHLTQEENLQALDDFRKAERLGHADASSQLWSTTMRRLSQLPVCSSPWSMRSACQRRRGARS